MNQCNKFRRKMRILSLCFIFLAAATVFAVTPFAFAEDQTGYDEATADLADTGISEEGFFIPPVSFTNVAPFGEPVQGVAPVYAARAAGERNLENDKGMNLSKTATAEEDGSYTIRMEAYATGQKIISEISKDIPTDIVLVLDQSGSMDDPMGEDVSRLDVLKNAVTDFAGQVAAKAAGADGNIGTDDDINHRIAVVGFASGYRYNRRTYDYGNTEIFVGSSQYKYGTAAQGQYANAFQDMNTGTGVNNINASIGALDGDGGTLTNLGLEMANGILEKNPLKQNEKRNRVVIVFTDGVPGWSGYDKDIADSAISQAGTAKSIHGATVYSIGIFSGADASSAGSASGSNETALANWFMQNLSSNNGTPQNPSYYLSAGDAGSLNNIFRQISDQIETGGSSSTLDSHSVVKDVVSPYFTMPENASEIKVYTADSDGSTERWKEPAEFDGTVKVDPANKAVSVSGFSFKDHWCGEEKVNGTQSFHNGKKLIIEFRVLPRSGFLGGNGVPTNGIAGIYVDGNAAEPVRTFENPVVDVLIPDITVDAADKNIYLLGGIGKSDLYSGAKISADTISLDLSKADYGLESWQTEFVDIRTSISVDGADLTDDGLQGLTEDTLYRVNAVIAPKIEGSASEKQSTGEAHINVFKPEVTFKDSRIYLGQSADYENNFGGIEWKHGETTADGESVSMIGTAPELHYVYSPEADAFTKDTNVKAIAEIGEEDVTSHVVFKRTTLENTTEKVNHEEERTNFIVFVKGFDLTIQKQGAESIDENQSFVFRVEKFENDAWSLVTKAVILGNQSVTVKELPIGTYRVMEDEYWSWRYQLQSVAGDGIGEFSAFANQVTFTGTDDVFSKTLIFTNTREKTQWLNGSAFCQNYWVKDGDHWKVESRTFSNQKTTE